jgi:hypothetical protein
MQASPTRDQQTPAALAAFQAAEIERWWPIVRAMNLQTNGLQNPLFGWFAPSPLSRAHRCLGDQNCSGIAGDGKFTSKAGKVRWKLGRPRCGTRQNRAGAARARQGDRRRQGGEGGGWARRWPPPQTSRNACRRSMRNAAPWPKDGRDCVAALMRAQLPPWATGALLGAAKAAAGNSSSEPHCQPVARSFDVGWVGGSCGI